MNPQKVIREKVRRFTDLPNIGPAAAHDFELLGFSEPAQLAGADPLHLYESLCVVTGTRHDPCVLDVFMSVTDFLGGVRPSLGGISPNCANKNTAICQQSPLVSP